MPVWASLSSTSGTLTGLPNESHIGTYNNIRITVSDSQAEASLPEFSITVYQGTNLPPFISGNPPDIVGADRMFSFIPTSSDPNGDPLSFSVSGKPSWTSFSVGNGRLSGIPGDANIGVHGPVTITVHDPSGAYASMSFDIVVVPGSEVDRYGVLPAVYLLLKNKD